MQLSEFEIIENYFKPLACEASSYLSDDVALMPEGALLSSTDTLIEQVHFFSDDPADQIAQKLLRVNLSDIIAKGATPVAYTLACSFSPDLEEDWIKSFSDGLKADQEKFGLKLLGGDTTVLPNNASPQVFTVNIFGQQISKNKRISRAGASVGDIVFTTGTIGDSGLGLQAIKQGKLDSVLIDAYRIPAIPYGIEEIIAQYATSSVDISDGLLADINHIAQASGVLIELNLNEIPLSTAACEWLANDKFVSRLLSLSSSGDDYQTAFTINPHHRDLVYSLTKQKGLQVTEIGTVLSGNQKGLKVIFDNQPLELENYKLGYKHF